MDIKKYVKIIAKYIERPLVIFDLETTGVDTTSDEIVQFAATKIYTNGSTEELEFLCKPTKEIPKEASDIHGISNEAIADKPEFKVFAETIYHFFQDADVAGYNINGFDTKMLDRHMEKAGYPELLKDAYVLDAYILYKKECTRKLGDACIFYTGKKIEDAHDALGDVHTTVAVLARQFERHDKKLVDIASETTGKPKEKVGTSKFIIFNEDKEPVLNFSKHKGTLLKNADKGFLQWMLRQDFCSATKGIVKQYV
jgi:DNA polymerase-3 subunit epsilon